MRSKFVAAALGALFSLSGLVLGADTDQTAWQAGLARVDITPQGPIAMSGYGPRVSEGVLDRLEAKALLLIDSDGHRGLLLTADLLFFRQPFAEELCRRIMAETGLHREQILLNASHTHSGPVFGLKDPERFDLSAPERKVVDAYTGELMEKLVGLAVQAGKKLEPARLHYGVGGPVGFAMNRRKMTDRGVVMAPNPEGPVDRGVPVLRVDDPDGELRAVVFGCACHNVTLGGDRRKISADYAGAAQRYIEKARPQATALFMSGCGADANSHPRGGPEQEKLVARHGETLGSEVCRVLDGELASLRGPLRTLLHWTELPLRHDYTRDELAQLAGAGSSYWHCRNAQGLLALLDAGKPLPKQYRAAISLWRFGDDLTFVGLPGEGPADYVRMIGDALKPDRLWVASFCNESFGYLPTASILAEGGHESMCLTLEIGFFAPSVERVVVDTVERLARKAGR